MKKPKYWTGKKRVFWTRKRLLSIFESLCWVAYKLPDLSPRKIVIDFAYKFFDLALTRWP